MKKNNKPNVQLFWILRTIVNVYLCCLTYARTLYFLNNELSKKYIEIDNYVEQYENGITSQFFFSCVERSGRHLYRVSLFMRDRYSHDVEPFYAWNLAVSLAPLRYLHFPSRASASPIFIAAETRCISRAKRDTRLSRSDFVLSMPRRKMRATWLAVSFTQFYIEATIKSSGRNSGYWCIIHFHDREASSWKSAFSKLDARANRNFRVFALSKTTCFRKLLCACEFNLSIFIRGNN